MRVVHLVGTNHKYQVNPADCHISCGVSESASADFCRTLQTIIKLRDIRGIAEEMSQEGLAKLQGVDVVRRFRQEWPEMQDLPEPAERHSICFNLAKEMGLRHRYCDPGSAIRVARGIKDAKGKESYWIEQLCSFDTFPVLFILGADHLCSFTNLLKDSDLEPIVEVPDWEPSSGQ